MDKLYLEIRQGELFSLSAFAFIAGGMNVVYQIEQLKKKQHSP